MSPVLDLAGVDGCRAGWLVARLRTPTGRFRADGLHWSLMADFAGVAELAAAGCWVAVDIPIGLDEAYRPGGRDCDRAARQRLGPRRHSVFSPPARPALSAGSFQAARRRNAGRLNRQSYNLFPKLRAADALMTPAHQAHLFEAHPELAFARLAGGPLDEGKRSPQGRRRRFELLAAQLPDIGEGLARWRGEHPGARVGWDDLLDASVLTLTAYRIATGQAVRLPEGGAAHDARGLEMAIWY